MGWKLQRRELFLSILQNPYPKLCHNHGQKRKEKDKLDMTCLTNALHSNGISDPNCSHKPRATSVYKNNIFCNFFWNNFQSKLSTDLFGSHSHQRTERKTLTPLLDQPNKEEILHNSLTAIYWATEIGILLNLTNDFTPMPVPDNKP